MAHNDDDLFDAPSAGGDLVKWENVHRRLLLIKPLELVRDIETKHGTTDAIRCDVHVLQETDGAGRQSPPGEVYLNTLVFPRVLQSQLRNNIAGKPVIGRLGQGVPTKGDPPWQLSDPTDADRQTARKYWQGYLDGQLATPATPGDRSGGSGNSAGGAAWSGGSEPPF